MRRYRVLIGVGVTCLVAVLLLLGGFLSKNSVIIIIAQAVIAAISIFLTVWGIKQLVKGIKSTLISKPGKGRFLDVPGYRFLFWQSSRFLRSWGFRLGLCVG